MGTACTTTQVGILRNRYNGTDHDLHYTYDPNGNILSVSDGTYTTSYTYDGLNQLIWEYNEQEQKAWQHAYDTGGNITSVTEYDYNETEEGWITSAPVTKTCTYGSSTWKDLLTGYNGSAVTYDGSGNILSCNGKTFAWQGGHRLKSMTADGTSLAFEYNADGLRRKKTGGGATHLYGYRGTKLISDKTGTDTLLFRYDSRGNILGFTKVTASSTEHYTYVKNLQGDILGILNSSGTEIASYTYDAWGRVLTVTGSDLSLAERNPIRYRGYYYDTETQLYYLQSRYYDPELRRFISPDSYAQTYDSAVGANMFAYCGNEPVKHNDYNGHSWLEDKYLIIKSRVISFFHNNVGTSTTFTTETMNINTTTSLVDIEIGYGTAEIVSSPKSSTNAVSLFYDVTTTNTDPATISCGLSIGNVSAGITHGNRKNGIDFSFEKDGATCGISFDNYNPLKWGVTISSSHSDGDVTTSSYTSISSNTFTLFAVAIILLTEGAAAPVMCVAFA